MAAEVARASGLSVDVFEAKGSVGRKFLIAGKGGLNLTHSEERASFVARYGSRSDKISQWLDGFDAEAVREWARGLGVDTFVGTSGRVFPRDLKAAPLLRAWVRRLREQGVRFHVHHECIGFDTSAPPIIQLQFTTPSGAHAVGADAVVLSMGGGSWPELGSTGRWTTWLPRAGVDIAPLKPSNCGFDVAWSEVFAQKYAGHPVKSVVVSAQTERGIAQSLKGEFVVTRTGIEGSAIYALSAVLRDALEENSTVHVQLDLAPDRDWETLQRKLSVPRNGRSLTGHLRRTVGIEGVKAGLLYETMPKPAMNDPSNLATAIKTLSLQLLRTRPLAEAISTAGGVTFSALDDDLMLISTPGVFCAGEMIDWEAPTGGYLLTACFASGRVAGRGAVAWLERGGCL